ncbi:MAG: hypothetical protein CMJ32_11330 [Phycisphaerae bacterium]|nr:hypothetical protein [Phycisphaerae bacterium]
MSERLFYATVTLAGIGLFAALPGFTSQSRQSRIDTPLDTAPVIGPGSIVPDPTAFDHPYVENELIVRFKPEATDQQRQDMFDSVKGVVKHAYTLVPDLYCLQIDMPVTDAIGSLQYMNQHMAYIEPVYLMETFEIPNDPQYGSLYGMSMINMPEAWDEITGDANLRIAIIDSGCDMDHPDLVGNIITNPADPPDGIDNDGNGLIDDTNGWDFYDGDNNPNDQNGHGTHTGGTVGAVGNNGVGVVGCAWQCELIPLRVGNQLLSTSAIYASVEYACEMGAKVSNNSYGGGGYAQAFYDIIQAAGNQCDHVFCAAAGNGGFNEASYPALYNLPNIISVASVNSSENLASSSQYGIPSVDIAAPGVNVLSTVPGGYDSYSGTSMATPHVAGVAALIHAKLGNGGYIDVVNAILDNARPVSNLNGLINTGGILDAEAAMEGLFAAPTATLVSQVPTNVEAGTELEVIANIQPNDDTITSVNLVYRFDNGSFSWLTKPMTFQGSNTWSATVPAADCDDQPDFYVSYTGSESGTATLPEGGSSAPYAYEVGELLTIVADDFNSNTGWSVSSGASIGNWERAVPSNDSISTDDCIAPGSDADGSGSCYVTGNGVSTFACEFDIDDGTTVLTSPVYDVDDPAATASFYWWYDNTNANNTAYDDDFIVEVSGNSGSSWTSLFTVSLGDSQTSGWTFEEFVIDDFVNVSSGFRIRFTASDTGDGSVVEAGVDGFSISVFDCGEEPGIPGDYNNDGIVDGEDLGVLLGAWGTFDCEFDLSGDAACLIDGEDLGTLLGNWTSIP